MDAAVGLHVLQFVDGGEVAVDERGVGERPQMFGGLQLRRVGRQEEQVDVLGHTQPHAGMPARTVEDEHNLLGQARADLLGERGQLHFKEGNADCRGELKDRAARGGMDEAD